MKSEHHRQLRTSRFKIAQHGLAKRIGSAARLIERQQSDLSFEDLQANGGLAHDVILRVAGPGGRQRAIYQRSTGSPRRPGWPFPHSRFTADSAWFATALGDFTNLPHSRGIGVLSEETGSDSPLTTDNGSPILSIFSSYYLAFGNQRLRRFLLACRLFQ